MSAIAKLYDDVMAAEHNKTAAANDEGPEFTREFFEKVASGDQDAAAEMNQFIETARADGHSDDVIEAAITEAMNDVGASDEPGPQDSVEEIDEFEQAKAAAYYEGVEEAVADVLGSDLAKEAGITEQHLIDYELGAHKAVGYAETRKELDERVQKIASHVQSQKDSDMSFAQRLVKNAAKGKDDKKGMSGAAKAGLGTVGAAGAGTVGLSALGKGMGGNFTPASGARGLRAAGALAKQHGAKTPAGLIRAMRLIRAAAK